MKKVRGVLVHPTPKKPLQSLAAKLSPKKPSPAIVGRIPVYIGSRSLRHTVALRWEGWGRREILRVHGCNRLHWMEDPSLP